MKQTPTLETITRRKGEEATKPARGDRTGLTTYVDRATTFRSLKQMALDTGRSGQDIVEEAIKAYLQAHGY